MGEKLWLVRGALYGLVGLIVLLFSLAVLSADNRSPQRPEIKPLERPAHTDQTQKPAQSEPSEATGPHSDPPSVPPSNGRREGQADAQHGREHGPKGEGGFLGTPLSAEAVIAVFTILLFAATLALYLATRDLVKGADRTAERQLRAYVGIDQIYLSNINPDFPIVGKIIIRNFGQTPAFDQKTDLAAMFLPAGVFDFDIASVPRSPNPMALMPGSTHEVSFPFAPADRIKSSAEMRSGKIMWVVGEITYTDAFGIKRVTSVRMYAPTGSEDFLGAPTGNEAT